MKVVRSAVLCPFAAFAIASPAVGATVPGFDAFSLPSNDDGSSEAVSLGFQINFFGETYDDVFVNNNGNVTFDEPLSLFTPFDLTSTATVIIAPFFADVDTRPAGESGSVTYGQGSVDGRSAFGVNWDEVGFFSQNNDLTNTFQLLLIDRSDVGAGDFDFVFNYDQIEFETGDASGGTDGLGGSSARAGYSNGSGEDGTFFEIEGSAINGAFLAGGPNSLVAAETFLFEVRNGQVIEVPIDPPVDPPVDSPVDPPVDPPTDPTVIPTPTTAGLGLLALTVGAARRRHRGAWSAC